MVPTDTNPDTCQKPGCDEHAEETYRGEHDNKLRLCGKHYYKLVTGDRTVTDPLGLGSDTIGQGTDLFHDTSTAPDIREIEMDSKLTEPL